MGALGIAPRRRRRRFELYARLLAEAGTGPKLIVGHSYGAIPAVLLASELAARGNVLHLVLIAPALREHPQARAAPSGTALLSRALGVRGVRRAARLTVLSLPARAVAARAAGVATYGPDVVTASAHRALRDRAFHPRARRVGCRRDAFARPGGGAGG